MRYSILDITPSQVVAAGGQNVKAARHTGIVFATLTEAQAKQLASLGYKVQSEKVVKADTIAPPTPIEATPTYSPAQFLYIAKLEELRNITDPPLYGEGFNLAVLDTGIRETHDQIRGRVIYRKNFTSDPMRDGFDHGTGIAAIAVALAPLANILNMKVLGEDGAGTVEEVIMAVDDCIDLLITDPDIAPHVINLSLGAIDDGNVNDPLRVACRAAINNGIWIIASAGNSGPAGMTITSPATEEYVVAVGSVRYLYGSETFAISDYSSRGPTREGLVKPDVVIFGEDFVIASSKTDTATAAKSGTSFSTSFISAMGVLYHEAVIRYGGVTINNGIRPEEVWSIGLKNLMDVHLSDVSLKPQGAPTGKDNEYGYGMPFGPYIIQAITTTAPALELSGILSGVIVVGMMGMMMKGIQ